MARLILKSPYLKCDGNHSVSGYLRYIGTRERVEILPDDRPDACQFQRLQHLHGALPARHIGTVKRGGPFQPGLFAGDLRRHFTAGHLLIDRPQVRRRLRCLFPAAAQQQAQGYHWYAVFNAHPVSLRYSRISRMASGSFRTTSSGVTL